MKASRRLAGILLAIPVGPAFAGDTLGNNDAVDGKAIYAETCLSCHMENGGGVPFMQPPLKGSSRVTGDPDWLIDWVLWGTTGRQGWISDYQNAMPGFSHLSDGDLAAVLSYVRNAFGNEAAAISAAQVAAVRAMTGPNSQQRN